MGNCLYRRGWPLFLLLFLGWTPGSQAHDLVLKDLRIIQVGACDRQARFSVELQQGKHQHVSGEKALRPVDYRIGVYNKGDHRLLYTFMAGRHKVGETLYFAVPSEELYCTNHIEIRVDDKKRVEETDENNNRASRTLKPLPTGLASPCADQLDSCR